MVCVMEERNRCIVIFDNVSLIGVILLDEVIMYIIVLFVVVFVKVNIMEEQGDVGRMMREVMIKSDVFVFILKI